MFGAFGGVCLVLQHKILYLIMEIMYRKWLNVVIYLVAVGFGFGLCYYLEIGLDFPILIIGNGGGNCAAL